MKTKSDIVKIKRSIFATVSVAWLSIYTPTTITAQEAEKTEAKANTIEEIIVTATLREEINSGCRGVSSCFFQRGGLGSIDLVDSGI